MTNEKMEKEFQQLQKMYSDLSDRHEATKKENGDWEIFKDDVLNRTITPLDNKIKLRGFESDSQVNSAGLIFDLHQIIVDGGVYMLVRASDRMLQLPLDPLG